MTRWRRANRTTTVLPDPRRPSRPPPPGPSRRFLPFAFLGEIFTKSLVVVSQGMHPRSSIVLARAGFYAEAADRRFSTAWFSRGREHIDSRDGVGRSDSAPFSLSPLLPRRSASLPLSRVARAVLPFRPVDGDIYGELYDSAFFTWTIRGAVFTGHGEKGWRVLTFSSVIYTLWKNI